MKTIITRSALVLALSCAVFMTAAPRPASADEASTAAIIAGAAAIVGAILYDNSGQPYYVQDGRHHYISDAQANYYRERGNNDRNAWAPVRSENNRGNTGNGWNDRNGRNDQQAR